MTGLPPPEHFAACAELAAEQRASGPQRPISPPLDIEASGRAWLPCSDAPGWVQYVPVHAGLRFAWGHVAGRADVLALVLYGDGDPARPAADPPLVVAITPAGLRALAADLAAIADAAERVS